MGMNRVALAAIDSDLETVDRLRLSDPLDTTEIAVNHYRIPPGSGFPSGVHAHMDQEEVFVVLDGTAAFETMAGTITVEAGEAIRFGPGEFQSGANAADEDLVALALGAPRESEDVRVPLECPECDHPNLRIATANGLQFVCPDCSLTQRPKTVCPACGGGDLRVTLDADGQSVVGCSACETEFESPPLRG